MAGSVGAAESPGRGVDEASAGPYPCSGLGRDFRQDGSGEPTHWRVSGMQVQGTLPELPWVVSEQWPSKTMVLCRVLMC